MYDMPHKLYLSLFSCVQDSATKRLNSFDRNEISAVTATTTSDTTYPRNLGAFLDPKRDDIRAMSIEKRNGFTNVRVLSTLKNKTPINFTSPIIAAH
jgi:hypothetical protein